MDLIRVFIETAFCRNTPDAIEDSKRVAMISPDERQMMITNKQFVNVARRNHPEYSDDNLALLYELSCLEWCFNADTQRKNIFFALPSFTQHILQISEEEPIVDFNHLFRWQQLSQLTGEDLLVCAHLAYAERFSQNKRNIFSWATILSSSNMELRQYLRQEGVSDLHQHLKASTDVFGISWVCLMNIVQHRMSKFYKIVDERKEADHLYLEYIEAAAIRYALFETFFHNKSVDEDIINKIVSKARFGDTSLLQARINMLRYAKNKTLDYACNESKEFFDVFCGERRFLYVALKTIYRGTDERITRLFYRYVLIKGRIREKMVQINKNIGFANFSRYEERKEMFIEGYKAYEQLLKILPLYEASKHHGVRYAETRIAPKPMFKFLLKAHSETEELIKKGLGKDSNMEWHIIYHFIKKEDEHKCDRYMPRNHRVRIEVRNQAVALKKLLSTVPDFVGIDAANSEMYCRPEVFAQAYRYLDDGRLKRTYHVGEDFYDLTDGIRAIDEAVKFLQLRQGDRLGHCIALGIDPEEYYSFHHWHIPVPKQVLLDNMVWLYFESKRYNIILPPIVEGLILNEYRKLIYMYEKAIQPITMEEYYYSMKLRGDSPYTYTKSAFSYIIKDWNSMAQDGKYEYQTYRGMKSVPEIFKTYHFNKDVKKIGNEVVDFKVPHELANVLKDLQDSIMGMLAKKQICIECCPTSNVKIGRLEQYSKHPVFRFLPIYNSGQLHPSVTINTDDLGIFTTSLENEYALLVLALLKEKDKNGNLKYESRQLRQWLNIIIQNGKIYQFRHLKKNFYCRE